MAIEDPYIYDPWENSVDEPMRTIPDVLKDLVKTLYNKTLKKQEEYNLSDSDVVMQDLGINDVMYGNALFIGAPSDVGVSNPLNTYNYYYEIPFKFFDEYDYFGSSYFIGATDHLTSWSNNYFAVESAVDNDYFDYYGGLISDYIENNNITSYVLRLEQSSGDTYPYMDYYTGAGGVLSHTMSCFTYQYNVGGNRIVRDGSWKNIRFGTHKFGININNGMKQIVSQTGGGNVPYITQDYFCVRDSDDSFFMVATDNTTITNTYINNVDNSVQYHNTYTYNYDGDTYTINYGDNYIVMPQSGDGLSYDDWRLILLPIIDDLNQNSNLGTDIVFPTYTEIKYGDVSDFYIEPLHQYDKLSVAPSFDGSISFGDIPKVVGESANSYLALLGTGLSALLCGCFITAFIVKKMGR